MSHEPDARLLETCRRIGARLVESALWEGDACTWQIMSPDRENYDARVAKPAIASGTLYEGTSGIAVYLAELGALTGDEAVRRTALGAIRHALADGAGLPDFGYGFHGGRVGIAYAAVRVAESLDAPELVPQAEELLRPMLGNEQMDRGIDVIGGAAGAIPALLWLAGRVDAELVNAMARNLGDQLIAIAEKETVGWSWGTMRSSSIRNLCGYAHGAAGVAHGLLELAAATGEGAYLYAAEQALLYERAFYNETLGNWPDLRHNELGEYQFAGRMEQLRDRLRRGDPLARQDLRYMSAWCHGAPGIGLTRLRAWQLLGDERYLAEARGALRGTDGSLDDGRMNFSLCHGRGGNAETLIVGADVLGEPELRRRAEEVALSGIRDYEEAGRPWPCGTLGGVSDPGMLLGEAGIGYFLLRLARPETPSVLLVTPPGEGVDRAAAEPGYAGVQRRAVEEHFGRTLALFGHLGEDASALVPDRAPGAAPERSDVERACDLLAARVAAEPDGERRDRLDDAFRVDRARYELARSVTDFTEEFLDALVRPAEEEVRWPEARLELSPRARLVHCAWDWDAWLEAAGAAPGPEADDVFYLLLAMGNRVAVRRLSAFAALVLQTVESPAGVDEVAARVEEAVAGGAGAPDRGWVEQRVVEQLRQAYRAGFIGVESGVPSAAAGGS